MSYSAGDVMDSASVLLNDKNKALFDYPTQLPYLKMAIRELEDELTLNESPLNLISEIIIPVPALSISLALPTSFFLPISLQERLNSGENFSPMREVKDVYKPEQGEPGVALNTWDYRHNCVNFVGATVAREVRLEYWRSLVEPNTNLSVVAIRRAQNALAFRTAALCAEFIGSNLERAKSLNGQAAINMDIVISLAVKNNQGNRVRRKPFRVGMTG